MNYSGRRIRHSETGLLIMIMKKAMKKKSPFRYACMHAYHKKRNRVGGLNLKQRKRKTKYETD